MPTLAPFNGTERHIRVENRNVGRALPGFTSDRTIPGLDSKERHLHTRSIYFFKSLNYTLPLPVDSFAQLILLCRKVSIWAVFSCCLTKTMAGWEGKIENQSPSQNNQPLEANSQAKRKSATRVSLVCRAMPQRRASAKIHNRGKNTSKQNPAPPPFGHIGRSTRQQAGLTNSRGSRH